MFVPSFSGVPAQLPFRATTGSMPRPRFKGATSEDKEVHGDTVQLSGQSNEAHLELAERYANNRCMGSSALQKIVNLGKNTFARLANKPELQEKSDKIDTELLKESFQHGETFFKTLEEDGVPDRISRLLIQAIAETYSEEDLEKLNKLYEDPETATLLNRQIHIFGKLLMNPEFEAEVNSITGLLQEQVFSLLPPKEEAQEDRAS